MQTTFIGPLLCRKMLKELALPGMHEVCPSKEQLTHWYPTTIETITITSTEHAAHG